MCKRGCDVSICEMGRFYRDARNMLKKICQRLRESFNDFNVIFTQPATTNLFVCQLLQTQQQRVLPNHTLRRSKKVRYSRTVKCIFMYIIHRLRYCMTSLFFNHYDPPSAELFQEDLYPDTLADVPAITADEWWSGTNADPILVPVSESGVQVQGTQLTVVCVVTMTTLEIYQVLL